MNSKSAMSRKINQFMKNMNREFPKPPFSLKYRVEPEPEKPAVPININNVPNTVFPISPWRRIDLAKVLVLGSKKHLVNLEI